jgi:hypothetical protein
MNVGKVVLTHPIIIILFVLSHINIFQFLIFETERVVIMFPQKSYEDLPKLSKQKYWHSSFKWRIYKYMYLHVILLILNVILSLGIC